MVQNPFAGLGNVQCFSQKRAGFQNLNAFVAHGIGKGVMILLRLFDPKHIVKEQMCAVIWRQATMRQTGAADNDLPQLTAFGMNTEFIIRHDFFLLQRMAATLSAAEINTSRIRIRGQMKTIQRS